METNPITAQLVQHYLQHNPLLLDYLQRDILNVTGLARELLPIISKENQKATLESISIAIHRLRDKKTKTKTTATQHLKQVLAQVQITMRTGISLFCLKAGSKLPDPKTFTAEDIFYINQGTGETTIIIDDKNTTLIHGTILSKKSNLAILSIKDNLVHKKINYRITPGFMNLFVHNISKEGINIEDIISTYSQLTFVVEEKDLLQVFKICNNVKNLQFL
ncbi:MAG: hypothetical protein Q7R96_05885 [Nanoarchaeota archaeon]|nr:hypothetical protein [Nanoarchaeota archaeon]